MKPTVLALIACLAACVSFDDAVPSPSQPVVSPPASSGPSIFDVRNPQTVIAAGTHVVLDGAGIRVSAAASDRVWIQEVDPTGLCDVASVVDYHGIAVVAAGAGLVPGAHVRVEGDVVDGASRTIANASITVISVEAPYQAHCERDASQFADRLDGVLVKIGADTHGYSTPDGAGQWTAATCFTEAPLAIGAAMFSFRDWHEGYFWVSGVVDGAQLDPRSGDDIVEAGDDVCL